MNLRIEIETLLFAAVFKAIRETMKVSDELEISEFGSFVIKKTRSGYTVKFKPCAEWRKQLRRERGWTKL